MIMLRIAAVFVVLVLLPPANAVAQSGWVGAGLGLSAASRGVGFGGRADARLVTGALAVGGRATINVGGPSEYQGLFGNLRDEYVDVALLVGYSNRGGSTQIIIAGGPSLVWGRIIGKEERPPCGWFGCSAESYNVGPLLGIAAEVGAFFAFSAHIGYSVTVHANLNQEQAFAGATIGLRVGKLH